MINSYVILGSYDVIVFFLIYGWFEAIRKLDSRHMVCDSYIFINNNLLPYKNWKQNLKISNTALPLLIWVKILSFSEKCLFFAKKVQISAKLRGFRY